MISITETPGVCGGDPCIIGTRLSMYFIQELVENGWSFERILNEYPHLRLKMAEFYDAMGRWFNRTNWRD